MGKEDLAKLEIGCFVTYELDRVAYTVVYKDDNCIITNDGVCHCGDSLKDFQIGAGYDGYPPAAYFYTTAEENEKLRK